MKPRQAKNERPPDTLLRGQRRQFGWGTSGLAPEPPTNVEALLFRFVYSPLGIFFIATGVYVSVIALQKRGTNVAARCILNPISWECRGC